MDEDDIDTLLAMASGADYVGDDDDDDDGDLEDLFADIVGGSDMIAGDVELVGRRMMRRGRKTRGMAALKKRAALVQAIKAGRAAQVERQGVSTVRAHGNRARRTFAGGEAVLTTNSGSIVVRTQENIRPDRVILSVVQTPAVGAAVVVAPEAITITDIKHGTRSQFSTTTGIDASVLTRDFFANGGDLDLDTIQAGTDFSLFLFVPFPPFPVDAANPLRCRISCQGRAMR